MTIKYITKHLFSIFSILIFLIIAFGSTDEEDMAKKETILRINPDTKEGKMVFDTIRKMNYNQMVDRFGSSYGFTEFGGTYECAWINITMKKKGINVWCTPYFEYSNSLHHLTGYRLSVCD
jgi:hypothetical protein